MEHVFGLMALIGGLSFIILGLCAANSIEANENEFIANVLSVLAFSGGLSFLVGFVGLICYQLK